MLTVIMIFLGIAVLLLFDGVLENYFPTTKEYSIQSPKIKKRKKWFCLRIYTPAVWEAKRINICK